jgi:rod shape-determining protein MreB
LGPACRSPNPSLPWSADIGGGTTEIAVMSLADVVASQSIRIAGDVFDEAIVRWLRRRYSLRIGELSAEQLKIAIGSAAVLDHELTHEVSGLDTASGIPPCRWSPAKRSVKHCQNRCRKLSMQCDARLSGVRRN